MSVLERSPNGSRLREGESRQPRTRVPTAPLLLVIAVRTTAPGGVGRLSQASCFGFIIQVVLVGRAKIHGYPAVERTDNLLVSYHCSGDNEGEERDSAPGPTIRASVLCGLVRTPFRSSVFFSY